MPGNQSHHDDDQRRQPHSQRPNIVQPLADIQTDYVHHRNDGQSRYRKNDVELCVVGNALPVAPDKQCITGSEIQYCGKIWKIARPVRPRRDKPAEVAEGAFAPDIKTAFLWVARGEFDYGKCERRIESQPGPNPYNYGARARPSSRGNPSQADAGYDVEKHQVEEAHHPRWLLGLIAGTVGRRRTVTITVGTNFGWDFGFAHLIVARALSFQLIRPWPVGEASEKTGA